ncbi:MAG TPA: hypothetical protein V6C72_07635 [Chroococcales cyanobacterium]
MPKLKLLLSILLSLVYTVPAFAQAGPMRNGLPPVSMDSFVYEAAGNAELIYGDEGVTNIPPYNEFTYEHRINNGIFGQRDAGLTTGHGSFMPSAWGDDEFLGAEWSQSGHNGGNPNSTGGLNNTTPDPQTPNQNPTGNPSQSKVNPTTTSPTPTANVPGYDPNNFNWQANQPFTPGQFNWQSSGFTPGQFNWQAAPGAQTASSGNTGF